jgi:hypothetical protein
MTLEAPQRVSEKNERAAFDEKISLAVEHNAISK